MALITSTAVEVNPDLLQDRDSVWLRSNPHADHAYRSATEFQLFQRRIGLNAVLLEGRSEYIAWEHLVGFADAHENRFALEIRIEF